MSAEIPVNEPQRPDLNIQSVQAAGNYPVAVEQYPWINDTTEVPTVLVTTIEGDQFRYGSMVGLSNSVSRLASEVPPDSSAKAEQSLFMAIPFIIRGETHPAVDQVMNQYDSTDLLKVGKRGPDAARLFFAVDRETEDSIPVVVKVGVARHKDQMKLQGLVGRGSSNLRKRDGSRR